MTYRITGPLPRYTVGLCLTWAWSVRLKCDACDHPPTLWAARDLARLPASATLEEIAVAARCEGCGSTRGELSTVQGRWGEDADLEVAGALA